MSAPVIDFGIVDDIRGIKGEDADVYAELIGIFTRDAPQRLASIRAHIELEALGREAHRLRGSSATMGFAALAAACAALEDACDAGNADVVPLVAAVVASYDAVVVAIRSL
jgi:HPt (histidine-containing phosphotransfer) domain-containing protein